MPSRRTALLLPLLAVACGDREEPLGPPPRPLGFSHLLPLPLNIANLDIAEDALPPRPGDLGPTLGTPPAAAVRLMAQDRLRTMGSRGEAVFRVTRASLLRDRAGLVCELACRLDVRGGEGDRTGFVEAQARATQTLSDSASPPLRARTAEVLLRRALDDLNVEFEFQLRRNLRSWLVEGSATPIAPAGVEREELRPPG
jgi:hypothetical protein